MSSISQELQGSINQEIIQIFHAVIGFSQLPVKIMQFSLPDSCHVAWWKSATPYLAGGILLAIISWIPILNSGYMYLDDGLRIFTHTNINQNVQGRGIADVAYRLLSLGTIMDISPVSQYICIASFVLTGCCICRIFDANINPILAVLLGTCMAVCPTNYDLISFRFDSAGFGISLLFATLAFYIAQKYSIQRFLLSSLLLFLSLGIYQVYIGEYFCLVLLFVAKMLVDNCSLNKVYKYFVYCCSIAAAAIIVYLPFFINDMLIGRQPFFGLDFYPGLKGLR